MWRAHPWFGTGYGTFYMEFPQYASDELKQLFPPRERIINDAHNEYLQILAETGLAGFLVFGGLLFAFFRSALKEGDDLLVLGVVALLVQNIVSVDMRYGLSLATVFILMGMRFSPENGESEPPAENQALRYVLVAGWVAFLGAVVLPALLKPYRAQRVVVNTPGFFDERVLDPAKSIADLERLAVEYPKEPAVLEKLAYVYAKEIKTADNHINRDMTNKAVATYERLIELDPKRLSAYNNTANILYTTGQVDAALAMWERALTVDPNFVDVHLNLGKIYYVKGRLKESAAHFEQVLKIQPGNNEAIVYLKRMVE
jgi:tetratricopeptide (TPR) repeat protein